MDFSISVSFILFYFADVSENFTGHGVFRKLYTIVGRKTSIAEAYLFEPVGAGVIHVIRFDLYV